MTVTKSELKAFREYIKSKTWKNARTYEKFAPHEYLLNFPCKKKKDEYKCEGNCEECKAERAEYEKWIRFVKQNGERARFGKRQYIMFCIDGYQYWTMDDDIENEFIFNRAIIGDPRCKIKTFWLDRR